MGKQQGNTQFDSLKSGEEFFPLKACKCGNPDPQKLLVKKDYKTATEVFGARKDIPYTPKRKVVKKE